MVSLMTSFSVVVAAVLSLSLEGGICYHLSREKSKLRSFFSVAIISTLGLWGVAIGLLLIFRNIVTETFLQALIGYPFVLIIVFVGILICNRLLIGLLQGLQFFRILSLPRSVTSLLLVVSLIFLHISGQLSILNALMVYALIRGFTLLVYISNLSYHTWKNPGTQLEGIWSKVLKFSLKQHLGTIFREVNFRLDYLILAYFLSINQLGFYSVAVGLSEFLWHIPMAIGITTFPRIAETELKRGYDLANQTVRLTLILGLLAGILFFMVGPILIVTIFGNKFENSVVPFLILIPGTVGMAAAKVALTSLSGLGKPGYQSINAFIVLFITVSLTLVLIPQYGILGVAIAKSAGYLIAFVISLIWLIKITKSSLIHILLPQKRDWEKVKRLLGRLYS